MSTINTTSINTTKTATYFTFDHVGKKIRGSEASFKKAEIYGTAQYNALMVAMERHPSYALTPVASKKKVEQKQTYAGLTFDLMTDYVNIKGNETIKAEFEEIVSSNAPYPTIKSWFLDYFKAGFTVEKAEREIEAAKKKAAQAKLKETKDKVRATVRAKTVKANSAILEMPTAQNF